MRPVYQTSNQQRRYTVMRPVYHDPAPRAPLHRDAAGLPDGQPGSAATRCMQPVYQTQRLERRYTVMRPVYQTVNQQRRYTVMRPVSQTTMVEQPYTVCRPVTTIRQVVEECGYYETQADDRPRPGGRASACRSRPTCGVRPRRSCSAASTRRRRTPPSPSSARRARSASGLRLAPGRPQRSAETRYVAETDDPPGPGHRPAQMVAEERVENIPVTTCQMVAEERVEPYEVRTCRWSPRSGSRTSR